MKIPRAFAGVLIGLVLLVVAVAVRAAATSSSHRQQIGLHVYHDNPLSRQLELINESGESLAVDWVHPLTGERSPFGVLSNEEDYMSVDSYVNHTFIIYRVGLDNQSEDDEDEAEGGAVEYCANHLGYDDDDEIRQECLSHGIVYLAISEDEEQAFAIQPDLALDKIDPAALLASPTTASIAESALSLSSSSSRTVSSPSPERASAPSKRKSKSESADIVQYCREIADQDFEQGKKGMQAIVEELVRCMESETAAVLEEKEEELSLQTELRTSMSALAENYTCADPTRETSEPIEIREWTHYDEEKEEAVTRRVRVLHNRPSSQIHVLENFISPEECEAIKVAAAPTLHRGTVADGKGGSRLSENRKAWQAGVKANYAPGNPIGSVKRRLYDYANHVTGYNMTLPGQEDLMSIQYFGRGIDGKDDPTKTPPDRYTPHCDGACDGMPVKTGARVATMVMYCDAPTLGGGTNFQNSNVFVKPKVGAAAFFSYLDPVTLVHETGFTSHSGCPVLEGTKRIAVQWMRIGVDEENPWDSFDTNTIKKSEYLEYEEDEEASC